MDHVHDKAAEGHEEAEEEDDAGETVGDALLLGFHDVTTGHAIAPALFRVAGKSLEPGVELDEAPKNRKKQEVSGDLMPIHEACDDQGDEAHHRPERCFS